MPTRLIKKVTGLFRNKSTSNTIATNEAPAPVVVSSPEPDSFPRVIKEEQHQIARKYLDDALSDVDELHLGSCVGGHSAEDFYWRDHRGLQALASARPRQGHARLRQSRERCRLGKLGL